MSYKIVKFDGFSCVGKSVKIPQGNSPQEIMSLWQDFLNNNIAEIIPGKINNYFVSLYTDYE